MIEITEAYNNGIIHTDYYKDELSANLMIGSVIALVAIAFLMIFLKGKSKGIKVLVIASAAVSVVALSFLNTYLNTDLKTAEEISAKENSKYLYFDIENKTYDIVPSKSDDHRIYYEFVNKPKLKDINHYDGFKVDKDIVEIGDKNTATIPVAILKKDKKFKNNNNTLFNVRFKETGQSIGKFKTDDELNDIISEYNSYPYDNFLVPNLETVKITVTDESLIK